MIEKSFLIAITLIVYSICAANGPGSWTNVTGHNLVGEGAAAVIENDLIYYIGGLNASGYSKNLAILNKALTINKTISLPSTIPPRAYHTWTNVKTGILLIGGKNSDGVLGDVNYYSFEDEDWSYQYTLPNLKVYKHAAAASITGDLVLMYGGIEEDGENDRMFIFTKENYYKPKEVYPNWVYPVPPVESAKLSFWQKVGSNKWVFILSGGTSYYSGKKPSMWKIVITNENGTYIANWEEMYFRPEGLLGRTDHLAYVDGSSLLLFGGSGGTSLVEKFNLADQTWYALESRSSVTPPPLSKFAWVQDDSTSDLIIMGGKYINSQGEEQYSEVVWKYSYDSCYGYIDCNSCTNAPSCGWCISKQSCISTTVSEPSYESCNHLTHSSLECKENCSSVESCSSCLLQSGCGWCQNCFASPEPFPACLPGNELGPSIGTCSNWLYTTNRQLDTEEMCNNAFPTFTVTNPPQGQDLAPGTDYYLQWEFDPIAHGFFRIYYEMNGTEYLISENVEINGGWARFVVPVIPRGAASESLVLVFKQYSPGSDAIVEYRSQKYTVRSPRMTVKQPKEGDIIYGDTNYYVKFNKDSYNGALQLVLIHTNQTYLPQKIISYYCEDEEEFVWSDFSDVKTATDYELILRHPVTETIFAESGVFSFLPKNISLVLLSPVPETENDTVINPGDSVVINWNCNAQAQDMRVSLYRDLNTSRERVLVINESIQPNDYSTWEANVTEEYDDYIFVVEEKVTQISVSSKKFTIKVPFLNVSVQGPKRSGNDIFVEEDKIKIEWDYKGKPCKKNIWIKTAEDSLSVMGIAEVDENVTSFTWKIPKDLSANVNYVVSIESEWGPLFAVSTPFYIVRAGSIGNRSLISVISLVGSALIAIIVLVVIYFKFLKKKRSGFDTVI